MVLKVRPQWNYEIYVTVQTDVSIIFMYSFDYICVYYLLEPTNAHIILKYILNNIFFSFSPSYFFQLAAILSQLTTKWLKTHSHKSVLTTHCMCMYSITGANLLLWILSYLVESSMRKATRQNMHETDNAKKIIYIHTHTHTLV